MATLTEGPHAGEFMISEANGYYSREQIDIAPDLNLKAGTILGRRTAGSISSAAGAGNAGAGTMGSLSKGDGCVPGVYRVQIIEPESGFGNFAVFRPDGTLIKTGDVTQPFTGEINFTLADGTPDFAPGDYFNVTVAAGDDLYTYWSEGGGEEGVTDGSGIVAGILYDNVESGESGARGVAIVRQAEVALDSLLVFDADSQEHEQLGDNAAAIRGLGDLGIVVRR